MITTALPAKPESILTAPFGAVIVAAFFVSGACSLSYEILAMRLLRLVMGNTTLAVTTVLTAFMGGLALGSYLGGRIADRRRDLLRVFAVLELAIGLYFLVFPLLVDATYPLYRIIYQNTHTSNNFFNIIRFAICGVLLLGPTTLMGATLPVLSRYFTRSVDSIGWSVGVLYAINTLGAVLGVLGAGFVLLPNLGLNRSLWLTCATSGLVSVAAYLAYRRMPRTGSSETIGGNETRHQEPNHKREQISSGLRSPAYATLSLRLLLIGYLAAGFASLVYEVAWTRVLALLIGSSVYAFTLMLTAFILGIGLGSLVFARWVDRLRDPMRALAIIEMAIGFSALLVVPLIGRMPIWLTQLLATSRGSFAQLLVCEFGVVLLIMLVPTTLMGAAFPVANRLYIQVAHGVGRTVGTMYSINTVGAIFGSIAGGFLLIPWLGLQGAIFAAVLVNVAAGCLFLVLAQSVSRARRGCLTLGAGVVAVVSVTMLPPWDPAAMSTGPYYDAIRLPKEMLKSVDKLAELIQSREVLLHREGIGTTVTVLRFPDGILVLRVNGKPDASSRGDLPTQILLAHVPLLLHHDPKDVLVIGLASGITLGSAGQHPVERLECVDIVPGMIEAAAMFKDHNHDILDDPRVKIITADGRNHLALTERQYDVIISEPSNPWIAGIGDLFTLEFFESCRDRLRDGGVVCIWLHSYMIEPEIFRSIVGTFHEVFPNTTLWNMSVNKDFLLVGCRDEWDIDYDDLVRRLSDAKIAKDLKRINVTNDSDFFASYLFGAEGTAAFATNAHLNTDDNALVEFAAPRSMTDRQGEYRILLELEEYRDEELGRLVRVGDRVDRQAILDRWSEAVRARGHAMRAMERMAAGRVEESIEEFEKAAALNPSDDALNKIVETRWSLARQSIHTKHFAKAEQNIRFILRVRPASVPAHRDLVKLLLQMGRSPDARSHLERAIDRHPQIADLRVAMGSLDSDQGRIAAAIRQYREAIKIDGRFVLALNNLAWILATCPDEVLRDDEEAVQLAQQVVELTESKNPRMLDTLSAAYASAGRFDEAQATINKALKLAESSENSALQEELLQRLKSYESEKPYRDAKLSTKNEGTSP